MTIIYLGFSSSCVETFTKRPDVPVSFLTTCPTVNQWERHAANLNVDKLCLDSGAYTVFNSGKEYKYADWLKVAKKFDCDEIFALDVIGDPKASWDNYQRAIADDVDVIPTFHIGEPWSYLNEMKKVAPKIALGVAQQRGRRRDRFFRECISRIWPHKIHAFGITNPMLCSEYPFHSIDSTTWSLAPSKFGRYTGFTGNQINLRSRNITDLWVEVEHFLKMERFLKSRWKNELAKL